MEGHEEILDRVNTRLLGEGNADSVFLLEAIRTIEDRLNIRLNSSVLPIKFESILVDAVVKLWRRQYYEGIGTEKIDTIQTTFIENILDEYDKEIQTFNASEGGSNTNVVRFI